MSSFDYLKVFVNDRLAAAAEEIFGVFKKTMEEYEEELDRQRKLLEHFWKPEIKLNRIGTPYTAPTGHQPHVSLTTGLLMDDIMYIVYISYHVML